MTRCQSKDSAIWNFWHKFPFGLAIIGADAVDSTALSSLALASRPHHRNHHRTASFRRKLLHWRQHWQSSASNRPRQNRYGRWWNLSWWSTNRLAEIELQSVIDVGGGALRYGAVGDGGPLLLPVLPSRQRRVIRLGLSWNGRRFQMENEAGEEAKKKRSSDVCLLIIDLFIMAWL